MSKRAGAVSAETKERILSAARAEFAAYGFGGSSLRRICAEAGVTTGALYFFFSGKDELFRSVLSEITEPFQKLVADHYARERASEESVSSAGEDADFEVTERVIALYFRFRESWDILLNHQNHPAVRAFLDEYVEESAAHYCMLLSRGTDGEAVPDRFAIRQFVRMQVDAMLTLLSDDFTQQEMCLHARTVIRMLRGAFQALLTSE